MFHPALTPFSPANPRLSCRRILAAWLLLACALLAAGCATPVSVRRVNPRAVHYLLTSNVLSSGELSGSAQNVLRRWNLHAQARTDPAGALRALHAIVTDGRGGADEVYTLAELSFQRAERIGSRPDYVAAAVYAYAYLFPEGRGQAPSPFDPRLRVACDLYNRSLTAGFATADGKEVALRSGEYALPFGTLKVEFNDASRQWLDRELIRFVPMAELEVRGMTNRYRRTGIGAPLAAAASVPPPGGKANGFVSDELKVPVTALLRLPQVRGQLAGGQLRGSLEIHTNADSVTIGGRRVPLESEPTAAYAWMLADSRDWQQEIRGFLRGDFLGENPTHLTALRPYQPGRIPVVLVHGTASSPGRWADLVNELENDPRLRDRIQIWLFRYDTGNMIVYSAMLLRQALEDTVRRLDPTGLDPALRRMVLVGHSQGGLLIKMATVDSGDRLWKSISSQPLEKALLRQKTRRMLQRAFFTQPLPCVKRLIYVATPHRGSFVATKRIGNWLARFIKLPKEILSLSGEMAHGKVFDMAFSATHRLPTSVDNMTPGNPFNKALAALTPAPRVATHSIIAVRGDGSPERGDDGVVKFTSAHVDGVESERVVRSGHSCQSCPEMIEEVRRILLLEVEGD